LQSARENQFRHIVFPREESRRKLVNFGPPEVVFPAFEPSERNPPGDEASFLAWLFGNVGLDSRQYRTETLRRRIPACLRTIRADSPVHAQQLLEQSPGLVPAALSAMLVGVTSFFRDAGVFEQLRNDLLPGLVESRNGVNGLSIGCSDGAELYSLAMLLAERGVLSGSYLLGMDCRSDAIAQAQAGHFEAAAQRQVPSDLRDLYLERHEGQCVVVKSIRQQLRWRVGNILGGLEMGLWDIILFRNTVMYMRPEAAAGLWPALETALRPGGILILGRAERPSGVHRMRAAGPCIYRRQPR
jgi:chemotaxis methyl-accepting protein methylase